VHRRQANPLGAARLLAMLLALAGSGGATGLARVVRTRPARPPSSRRYTPLDEVASSLGGSISSDLDMGLYHVVSGGKRLSVAVGVRAVAIGSEFYRLSSPVLVHYGRVYVPHEVATRAKKSFGTAVVKPPTPATPPKSVRYIRRVCIDPGHGGRDPGAGRNGFTEQDVVVPVGRLLGAELQRRGIEAMYTRTTNVFVPLDERPAKAARGGADLFISLHANASANSGVSGIEILYVQGSRYKTDDLAETANRAGRRPKASDVGDGVSLAPAANQAVLDMLFEEFRRESIELAEAIRLSFKGRGITVRSVREQNLAVLRDAEMPGVLVELGFLTNSAERRNLGSDWYQKKLAAAIADGIVAFAKRLEQTRGNSK